MLPCRYHASTHPPIALTAPPATATSICPATPSNPHQGARLPTYSHCTPALAIHARTRRAGGIYASKHLCCGLVQCTRSVCPPCPVVTAVHLRPHHALVPSPVMETCPTYPPVPVSATTPRPGTFAVTCDEIKPQPGPSRHATRHHRGGLACQSPCSRRNNSFAKIGPSATSLAPTHMAEISTKFRRLVCPQPWCASYLILALTAHDNPGNHVTLASKGARADTDTRVVRTARDAPLFNFIDHPLIHSATLGPR